MDNGKLAVIIFNSSYGQLRFVVLFTRNQVLCLEFQELISYGESGFSRPGLDGNKPAKVYRVVLRIVNFSN